MEWKINEINANLLKTTDEALLNVLKTMRHYLNLGTKEHIVTVQVQHVVRARSTAFSDKLVINNDPHILADSFD